MRSNKTGILLKTNGFSGHLSNSVWSMRQLSTIKWKFSRINQTAIYIFLRICSVKLFQDNSLDWPVEETIGHTMEVQLLLDEERSDVCCRTAPLDGESNVHWNTDEFSRTPIRG